MVHSHDNAGRHDHAHDACCGGHGHDHVHDDAPRATQARHSSAQYTFDVQGLDCAEEVALLKREVGPVVGGADNLAFDVLKGRMMVLPAAGEVGEATVRRAVERAGMKATPAGDAAGEDDRRRQHRMQVILTVASGVFLLGGLALHAYLAGGLSRALALFGGHGGEAVPWQEAVVYLLAIACAARHVVVKAFHAAKRLRPDMNLLMVIAVAGAIGIGEWFEAATVAFLFALSLLLESWSVGRARRAIGALLDLSPQTVRVRHADGREEEIEASAAPVGCRFVVRPGERIPLDGVVKAGSSAVNQAPITGESRLVTKAEGSEVYAGTINDDGALEVDGTRAADDTTLSRIIRMVEEAQSRRARAEQWVEKFARIYTPAVIVLALAVFLLPPLALGAAWGEWFYRALVLLVIACPCALVISTPVSIVAALASSARQGVLIKGGTYVEQPGRLRAIAFDKTGTLTRGEPRVVNVTGENGWTDGEVLQVAAALESRSDHPLARAILARAREQGLAAAAADDVQAAKGKGISGTIEGVSYWLGSHRQLLDRDAEADDLRGRAEALEAEGHTVVMLGRGRRACGLIALADTLRPEAPAVLDALHRQGVERLVMLTGDNQATASAIAAAAGIDDVRAELLPEDKVAAVEELVARYGHVAMVGDGVNDAPAMARASFGVAMGAIGSDAAIETADVALMSDDISRLPWLVDHSRRSLNVIRQNIAFSIAVKAVFVVLTFVGLATLWGAIAADVGATLLVVFNALRLLRPRAVGSSKPLASAPDRASMAGLNTHAGQA